MKKTQQSPFGSKATKQQVDITLKISLWLDASMDEDAIVTLVRSSMPNAFGEQITTMVNPVDILEIRQEAEIYGDEKEASQPPAYVVFQLADDHATYGTDAGKFIVTGADHEREYSGPMGEEDAKAFGGLLNALTASERFIRGFEDDVFQEGIADLLANIRAALPAEAIG